MASVTFKITKKTKFSETPSVQDPVVNGRIIFVMDDEGNDDNRIYLDYGDARKLYATALSGGDERQCRRMGCCPRFFQGVLLEWF